MKRLIKRANSFIKDFLLASRIGLLLSPFRFFLKFLYNFSLLSSWVNTNSRKVEFSDFYKPLRKYSDRINLFNHISKNENLETGPIHYFEFGVASGLSFLWWLDKNKHQDSKFTGFDTFEGLPEDWHFFKKGAFSHNAPTIPDVRGKFVKGLFQDTLYQFLSEYQPDENVRRVLHMDADLYSSTLFSLTMMAPYLKKGDILFFDEFNIPNHEFAAWNDFVRSYYIKYEVVGAVNNFYQTCFKII
jgi:O-methyltransferase